MSPVKMHSMFAALPLALILLSSRSEAAVIVTFEQVGNNVVATWNGTLDLGGERSYPWAIAAAARAEADVLISGFNGAVDIWQGGTAETTSLLYSSISLRTPAAAEWGFSQTDFVLGATTSAPGLTSFDFGTGSDYTLTWNDVTLASIGAGGFNNTLAWTSAAGDTIRYTTVPEPAATSLGILASIGLLSRRRRR
ncbi:MAG: hypothetical protein RLZ97_1198 [Verrucomicrobiota bacterium]|jgi:hypothetical protein